jgi:Predicted membrane protein
MESFLASFLLIFIAEMGDKTQLIAMAFTARFKASLVILAISSATIANNLIAVAAGSFLSGAFSVSIIQAASFILFILFGFWTLYGGEDDGENSGKKVIVNPFFTVALFFFISEFGDKTQIAAMTLTMKYSAPVQVLIGASAGMICANLIGIGAGVLLGKKIPAHIIRLISAAIFILFGLAGFWTVFYPRFGAGYAALYETLLTLTVFLAVIFILRRGKSK